MSDIPFAKMSEFGRIKKEFSKYKNVFPTVTDRYLKNKIQWKEMVESDGMIITFRRFSTNQLFFGVPVRQGECQTMQFIITVDTNTENKIQDAEHRRIVELQLYRGISFNNWYSVASNWNEKAIKRLIRIGFNEIAKYKDKATIFKLTRRRLGELTSDTIK